ncbi:MAG: hsp70 family protein [Myxococcales bacterium]|nr:hsp70 family protein [Myxococcales bacterium]
MSNARYVIGIDLGTTNTAVAFVDTQAASGRVEVCELPQLVAPGEVAPRTQLPSFVYLPRGQDLSAAQVALPWGQDEHAPVVVGELARAQGARHPQGLVSSAKSWLCHAGVNRHAAILPWGVGLEGGETPEGGGRKLSPVDASAEVLRHVRQAWGHVRGSQPGSDLANQDVVVTVPASFDEAARELTLEAAQKAGLPHLVLLEEPQAAFYAWVNARTGKAQLAPGESVLVFDVGGGTSDFTLITVGEDGDSFARKAVGEHLLLGGDNIDLTLAKHVEAGLATKLDSVQWHALVHACRMAKEKLLADDSLTKLTLTVPGRGTKLIGGALHAELSRGRLDEVLFEGFFPLVRKEEGRKRTRSGLQEFGLPFASDPAITRHLGAFLLRHAQGRIDAVLFNGGAMAPPSLRARVLEQVAAWQPDAPAPRELASPQPALAVAEGAAVYGLVRRGLGVRIGGGTPRSFYVGVGRVEGRERAVCIAPRGLTEGQRLELDRAFVLLTNKPVSFKLYSSTTRRGEPGAVVDVGDGRADTVDDGSDLFELPPLVTVVKAPGRAEVTVHLEVTTTEVGTLDLGCREAAPADPQAPLRWRLSFDMRAGGARLEGPDEPATLEPRVREAQALIRSVFRDKPSEVSGLNKALEHTLEAPRDAWSMSAARALFDAAFEVVETRTKSPQHEARWLHLAGYCLRPGCGAPADEWRAKQMWGIVFHQDLHHPKDEVCRLAWWITWRRVAGGLNKGQQHQLYLRLAQLFLGSRQGKKRWYEMKPSPQEAAEMLRCLGNLERCTPEQKATLGDELTNRMVGSRKVRSDPGTFWALGRLGARVPLYGPADAVVPPARVQAWIEALLEVDWPDPQKAAFPMAQLGRRTDDRSRDLEPAVRDKLASRLATIEGAERSARLVTDVVELEAREAYIALGETLPVGLRLSGDDGAVSSAS